jgi:hypothetical protein
MPLPSNGSPTLTEIKAADVSAADLDALENGIENLLADHEIGTDLADFILDLIASLRAGHDMVLVAADADLIAALTGQTS